MKLDNFPTTDALGRPISGTIEFFEEHGVGSPQKHVEIFADESLSDPLPNPLRFHAEEIVGSVFVRAESCGFEIRDELGHIVVSIDGISAETRDC